MTPADLAVLVRAEGAGTATGVVAVEAVPAAEGGCPVLRVRFAGEWLGDLLLGSAAERDRVVAALRAGAVVVVAPPGVERPDPG